jgi:plastocyanin
MRPLPVILIAALLVAAAPAAAATKNVKIGDDYYVRAGSPPTVSVFKGTTVKWNWRGNRDHDVLVRSGPVRFQSELKDSGSWSRRMRRAGTYKIVCSVHRPDMAMTLKVRRRG